jgi:S-adenosylmethionine:tRNA ribosyltransferase-isomerase
VSAALAPTTARFILPAGAEATAPAERCGKPRDGVRLLVGRPGGVEHRVFRDLPELLSPGDLVVVNTSATLPAALDAAGDDGRPLRLHVSGTLDDGDWVVEPRLTDGSGPDLAAGRAGRRVHLPGGVVLLLVAAYPDASAESSRLWRARPPHAVPVAAYLADHGQPITYGYVSGRYPLADYQTVFATEPGSAEMPSAARPFTTELVVRLLMRGIAVAPVVLHAGVSSPEAHEAPLSERFEVPESTARLVNVTRASGGRIVAVGTTVTRALETTTARDGTVTAAAGWTDLVLSQKRPTRVVTGLVSGLHPPEASHLLLLEAVAGPSLVAEVYQAAVRQQYRWHEFGDSSLFLP